MIKLIITINSCLQHWLLYTFRLINYQVKFIRYSKTKWSSQEVGSGVKESEYPISSLPSSKTFTPNRKVVKTTCILCSLQHNYLPAKQFFDRAHLLLHACIKHSSHVCKLCAPVTRHNGGITLTRTGLLLYVDKK